MKKGLFLLIGLVIFPITSYAAVQSSFGGTMFCTSQEQSEVMAFAANVTFSYETIVNDNSASYVITVSNLTDDMILVDSTGIKTYSNFKSSGSEIKIKTANTGQYSFDIWSKKCKTRITTKSISLPYFNAYYADPLCKGLEAYPICQKWSNYTATKEQFEKAVQELKKEINAPKDDDEDASEGKKAWYEEITTFFVKYWWALVLVLVLVGFIGYLINRKKKKNEYDFKL